MLERPKKAPSVRYSIWLRRSRSTSAIATHQTTTWALSRADTEHLSEMVFGTIDLSEKSSGYKVHPIDARNTLWSKLFYARKDDVLTPGSRRAVVARLVRTICQINLR